LESGAENGNPALNLARRQGMQLMHDDALVKVESGMTTFEEILRSVRACRSAAVQELPESLDAGIPLLSILCVWGGPTRIQCKELSFVHYSGRGYILIWS
jgi:hypothetical protein